MKRDVGSRQAKLLRRATAAIAGALLLSAIGPLALGPSARGEERPAVPAPEDPAGVFLVRYRPGTPRESAARLERALGLTRQREIAQLGIRVVRGRAADAPAIARALARDPSVALVERDRGAAILDTTPNDESWSRQWSHAKVAAPRAWDLTQGSPNVVVAVLDTGVRRDHPDLQGKVVDGYDFVNGDADATDDHGHGTNAAGVVAAATNNRIGVAGMCWACTILPVKVLDADGQGSHSTIAQGIVWAADRGAAVINLSLGGPATTTTLQDAVRYARQRGSVVVAAAGNSGTTERSYPAGYPEAISVAATDINDALYSWSNRGSWVKVAAPGCVYTTGLNDAYGVTCGTSFSSPAVAGVAGLLLSARSGMSAGEVESTIASTAVPFAPDVAHGRVDAYRAVSAVTAAPAPSPTPVPQPDADATPPAVTARTPASGAVGVAPTTAVTATFSEAVKGVSTGTFVLRSKATGALVTASVGYDAARNEASLKPSTALASGASYAATLSDGITDAAGNPLTGTSWTFTTASPSDTTRPSLTARSPAAGAVGVPRTTAVTATFTEPVKGVSTSSFVLRVKATGAVVSATVSYDATARKAVLRPASALGAGQSYTARLSSAITDTTGNALSATTWSFTTTTSSDITRPTIASRSPASGSVGVAVTRAVSATFSEPVKGVSTSSFVLRSKATGAAVSATVSYDATARKAVLRPSSVLAAGQSYVATASTAIRDSAGNALSATSWTFTTQASTTATSATATATESVAYSRYTPFGM